MFHSCLTHLGSCLSLLIQRVCCASPSYDSILLVWLRASCISDSTLKCVAILEDLVNINVQFLWENNKCCQIFQLNYELTWFNNLKVHWPPMSIPLLFPSFNNVFWAPVMGQVLWRPNQVQKRLHLWSTKCTAQRYSTDEMTSMKKREKLNIYS